MSTNWQEKIESMKSLKHGWDSYSAHPPWPETIERASEFLRCVLGTSGHNLTLVNPSVIGGVGFTFQRDKRKVYVEFGNIGKAVHVLYSDGVTQPNVDACSARSENYPIVIGKVKAYLSGVEE